MVRAGFLDNGPASRNRRGREPFVPVSWSEATSLVAAEIERIRRDHGNSAIFGGSYGWASAGRFHHAQSQLHRFLNLCGGYTRSVNTHSYAAAEVVLPHIIGGHDGLDRNHTPWTTIAEHTTLFVAFGGLPSKNAQVSAGGVALHTVKGRLAACRNTAFVGISPLGSDLDGVPGAEWLAIRPNTDTAMMMGIAHTLVAEDLHDRQFLTRYTTGFDVFLSYLLGESDGTPKDAAWAAPICGIPENAIKALARRMARERTMISVAWSLQRASHGEQPLWMAITLAAMLGQIGLPGGGFGFGYADSNRIGFARSPFSWPAFPQGRNPVSDFIPVARVADMLLNPGAPFDYNGGAYLYPDIRMVYWAGGNPFHHQQDINKLVHAWRRPETVIAHEPWWNPLARHADIVLPCATTLERNDLGIARDEAHLFAMHRAVPPFGEARSDYDILAGIAGKLGFGEAFTEGRDEMGWVRHMYGEAREVAQMHGLDLPDFDRFWSKGDIRLPDAEEPHNLFDTFRADPLANPLATPSGKIEIHSKAVAGFGYEDCPGHPVWLAPLEWLGGAKAKRFPLHLVSNQPTTRLHSQLDNGRVSRESKIADREPARLHPHDAQARGIRDGDVIRLFNDRGACLAGAVLSDQVMPGTVQLSTGAWYDPDDPDAERPLDRHGNANVLTLDRATSRLSQAPIAHSALVEVERFDGPVPPVGAFLPPRIVRRPSDADGRATPSPSTKERT
jgi:biotin/methionine sulfoxide reductase